MSKQDPTIYYISHKDIQNQEILDMHIYPNTQSNYYWSDDFSEDFYIKLAYCGFICVSNYIENKYILLPEMQFEYAVLHFKDLNISKKVNKLLQQNNYDFTINENFDELLKKLETYHEKCWLNGSYLELIKRLKNYKHHNINFQLLSIELSYANTKELIAGEIGYQIGSTYTSLTGFCNKNKSYNNWGTLQLVLLAQYLEKNNFDLWNLGHAGMQYKSKLGAKTYKRDDFLQLWFKSVDKPILNA